MSDKLVKVPENAMAITPMQVIQLAVTQGADVEKLKQLMELQERWEAGEARKAFSAALSAFKAANITVEKNRKVAFSATKYNHASLDNVCNTIGEELSKHGLSFRWNTSQNENKVKVTCVLMHNLGHSESVSLESSPDTSGSKNPIQAIGSAVSYLQRYTLLAITGTATAEQDDDARGGERPNKLKQQLEQIGGNNSETVDVIIDDQHITPDQATELGDVLQGHADVRAELIGKFGSIAKIPAKHYKGVLATSKQLCGVE